MSSRFVSAGGAEVKAPEGLSDIKDDAWAKARRQVEEARKPTEDGPAPGTQEGGKSLFEHLQDQKAAKQEAFEEASKLRNQFRPLDDAEVEFLDGMKLKEWSEAANVRKETAEQLDAFRKERAAAEELAKEERLKQEQSSESGNPRADTWATSKKRRRVQGVEKATVSKAKKLSPIPLEAKSATTEAKPLEPASAVETGSRGTSTSDAGLQQLAQIQPLKPTGAAKPSTLVTYNSDSDD